MTWIFCLCLLLGHDCHWAASVLGETHWLKLPTLVRHHSNHSCELFTTGGPGKGHRTNKPHQLEKFRKGQKETPCDWPPPRILLSGIHLGWTRYAPPRRTPSQNDWLKTTQKLIPHHHKTRDCKPHGRAVLLGSLTLLLSTQAPFPNKISCFVSTCVSSDNSFPSVRQEPSLGPWKGPPSYNSRIYNLHVNIHYIYWPMYIFSESTNKPQWIRVAWHNSQENMLIQCNNLNET